MSAKKLDEIRDLIERSSLGTKAAKAARESIPADHGKRLVRAAELRKVKQQNKIQKY